MRLTEIDQTVGVLVVDRDDALHGRAE